MDEVQAGQHAARILDDSVFQQAVRQADDRFIQMWRSADTPEARERAHALQAALTEVITQLGVIAGNGDLAARQR